MKKRKSRLCLPFRWKKGASILQPSNFGSVCSRLPYTSCKNLVKKLLYSYAIETAATKYGWRNEENAKNDLKQYGIYAKPCGRFIDSKLPLLVATPDRLIDDDRILEIKCPCSCAELTPEDSIFSRQVSFWSVDKENNNIIGLNKNHSFYYLTQGHMHIAQKEFVKRKWKKKIIFWWKIRKKNCVNFIIIAYCQLVNPRSSERP